MAAVNGTRMRRILSLLVVAGLVAGGIWMYLASQSGGSAPRYRFTRVERGPLVATVSASGNLAAVTTVQVGSQVSGIVARLHADYNSPVKRGQLLAELDPTPFQAQVEQRGADLVRAEVEMRNAGIAYRRSERLLAQGLLAEAEYDGARAAYESAKAQVDLAAAALRQARTSLSYTRIHSPIDGVVVARQYDIGQTVAASFQAPTLFTIAEDLTKMQVLVDVDQSDIGRVAVGQEARFTVDAWPEEDFSGRISQIRLNATQNQNVVTYPVIVEVANPGGKLRPMMTADVTIEVARVTTVLRVPNAALRFQPITAAGGGEGGRGAPAGRKGTVHVVGAGGALRAVGVRTGLSDGRFTQILDGEIREGDRVAVGVATARSSEGGAFPGAAPATRGRRPF
jgi:HlyD family secretion protein